MKLICRKLTKQQMIKMAKSDSCLYYIEECPVDDPYHNEFKDIIKVSYTDITGIKVNLETGNLEFTTFIDSYYKDDEPFFVSRRTAEIFMKKHYKNYIFMRDRYGCLYGEREIL